MNEIHALENESKFKNISVKLPGDQEWKEFAFGFSQVTNESEFFRVLANSTPLIDLNNGKYSIRGGFEAALKTLEFDIEKM